MHFRGLSCPKKRLLRVLCPGPAPLQEIHLCSWLSASKGIPNCIFLQFQYRHSSDTG